MALHACLVCGTPSPSRHCPAHKPKPRANAAARGYGRRWRKARAQFLKRHPSCACGQIATEVDHFDGLGPRSPRGYDPANFIARCKSCHSRRTARDQPGGFNAA